MKSCNQTTARWNTTFHLGAVATALLLCALHPGMAQDRRDPHIGYVYPAGGQQGTVFEVTVGGQFLQGAGTVHVSGDGVSATVIRHVKPLSQQQQGAVRRHMGYLRRCLQAAKAGKQPPPVPDELPELPDHPWLAGLAEMDLAALGDLQAKLFNPKKQLNPQLAETVDLQIAISKDARPGDRELRLMARAGLTNPLCFQVGALPEIAEREPNARAAADRPVLKAPIVLNGQMLPGEADRFILRARQGQQLWIDARARRLIPYLADAVPGWFQAIVTLDDADGNEVGYADDFRFHPDPFLRVEVPADGDYQLEIRDAIYRGREDFVYRIAITESPTRPAGLFPERDAGVDAAPEQEPNSEWAQAEKISLPHQVEGRLQQPGDVDLYRFEGRAGEDVVAEVFARRGLYSPVDALIKLVDHQHNTIAWNDDFMEKDGHLHLGAGLLTHHADAYLRTRLPTDGTYYFRMTDAQGHGGSTYRYQLRMSHPRPDFALRATPSSLTIPAGRTVPVEIHVMRWDGFAEAIDLALIEPAPGFALEGATIPPGKNRIRVTLTAPPRPLDQPFVIKMEGRARVAGKAVRRPVVPADDTMQAFLWRHLVPAQEWLVAVTGQKRAAPLATRVGTDAVRLAAGGEADIRIRCPMHPQLNGVQWNLVDPPPGVSLGKSRREGNELVLAVRATAEEAKTGSKDNLIIEARRPWNKGKKKQLLSLGVLPAIPIEITAGEG